MNLFRLLPALGGLLAVSLVVGCTRPASLDGAADPTIEQFGRPESMPNVTPQDMQKIKQDYKQGEDRRNKTIYYQPSQSASSDPTEPPEPSEPISGDPTPPALDPEPPTGVQPGTPIPAPVVPSPGSPSPSPTNPQPSPVVPGPTPDPAPTPVNPPVVPSDLPRYTETPSFDVVRVRLFPLYNRDIPPKDPFLSNKTKTALSLANENGFKIYDVATKKVIAEGKTLRIDFARNAYFVDEKKIPTLRKSEIVPNERGYGTTVFGLKQAEGTFKFEGSMVLLKSTVTNDSGTAVKVWNLVNLVYLEDYILSVTSSEAPAEWALPENNSGESVKAQSVAARSYGLNTIATSRKVAGREWDVAPTTANQAYMGIRSLTPQMVSLVQSTSGQIMVYDQKVILAAFSANSGGYTCSALDCWKMNIPYLAAREDAQEVKTLPGGDKNRTASLATFKNFLVKQKLLTNSKQPLEGISVYKSNDSQRVLQLAITTGGKVKPLSAVATTNALVNIFSSNRLFEVTGIDNSQINFTYSGFGHGIGMSQWGAYAFSRRGMLYRDILTYYYKDIQIISLEE